METKEYLHRLRRLELEEVRIEILDDLLPDLHRLVERLVQTKYVEISTHSNAYYGDIKEIIQTFVRLWEETIDKAIHTIDKAQNITTVEEYINLIEKTIHKQMSKQIKYGRLMLPATNRDEIKAYEETNKRYVDYLKELEVMRDSLHDLPLSPEAVALKITEDMQTSLAGVHKLFDFTEDYISVLLYDRLKYIELSIKENHMFTRNQIRQIKSDLDECLEKIILKLYEATKQQNYWLTLRCSEHRKLAQQKIQEKAELKEVLRNKMEDHRRSRENSVKNLLEEKSYWEDRLKQIEEIKVGRTEIKDELQKIIDVYEMSYQDVPKHGYGCEVFKKNVKDAHNSLLTLFAIKGISRNIYKKNCVSFHVDEHHHKMYNIGYEPRTYRVQCDGMLKEAKNSEKANGERVYVRKDCSSSYKLNEFNRLLEKDPPDCGHSEAPNKDCKVLFKEPDDYEIFPEAEKIDIKGTLEPEVTQYIWESLGAILPDAVADVLERRPHNAIHYLAHRLLVHKKERTIEEQITKQVECEKYRNDILNKRKEVAAAAAREWRAKISLKPEYPRTAYSYPPPPVPKPATKESSTTSTTDSFECD